MCYQTIDNLSNPTCVCRKLTGCAALFANRPAEETAENKTVDGDSYVGDVNSNDGQANLDRSNGKANDDNGVGLSMGRMEWRDMR